MEAAEQITAFLVALETEVAATGAGQWSFVIEAAGHPLQVELALRGPLLRGEAAGLAQDLIEPRQLLHWNRQAPLVCFAETAGGEVLVCGELPLQSLDPELLDRFLGLLVASATRARQFVLRAA